MSGTVIITGGSRGIGAAIARRLAPDGFAVAVGYAADADAAEAKVEAIRAAGGTAQAFQADLGDPDPVAPLFEAATSALGSLAALVNNAGIVGPAVRIDQIAAADLARLYAVNTIGRILACKEAALRLLTRHGGRRGAMVNLSSVGARLGGLPGLVGYATSKAAVENFTVGFAKEVGPEGIRVNAVAPCMIETDMTRGPLSDGGFRGRVLDMTPLRRVGQSDKMAEAVSWLLLPAARFVTGTTLTVSGGI